MVRGACLCGDVSFELTGPPDFMNHCHCRICRKASGTSVGTFLHVQGSRFRWLGGQDGIRAYESSPGSFRPFCGRCGSRVPVIEDDGAEVIIPVGTLDDDPGVRPLVHFHVASRAAWDEIHDAAPQFAEFPDDPAWERIFPGA